MSETVAREDRDPKLRKKIAFKLDDWPIWIPWWLPFGLQTLTCWTIGHTRIDMGNGPFCAYCLRARPEREAT